MGVCCIVVRLDDSTIDELLETPRKIHHFFSPDDPVEPEAPGLIGRLLGKKAPPLAVCSPPRGEDDSLDLDKSWDGLDFILSQKRQQSGICRLLTKGGLTIKEEIGYGNARAFRSGQVREFDDFLKTISSDDLRKRFDQAAMLATRVYPKGLWQWPEQDALDCVLTSHAELGAFVDKTVQHRQGLVLIFI